MSKIVDLQRPHGSIVPLKHESHRSVLTAMILSRLHLQAGAAVLDLPCGTGRISCELAAQGFAVTGIDFNQKVLDVARADAEARDLSIAFRQGDMRQLDDAELYDAAVCFWGSFGYFSDQENEDVVARVARALRPGAKFLIDTPSLDSLPAHFAPHGWQWVDEAKTMHLLEERHYDAYNSRLDATWTLVAGGSSVQRRSSIRLYTVRELDQMFKRQGFTRTEAFNGHQEGPFSMLSRRLVFVGTR